MTKQTRIEFRLEEHTRTAYIEHAKKRKQSLSEWIRQSLAKVFKKENL